MSNEPNLNNVTGKYKIFSAMDNASNMCLDIYGISQDDCASLILFTDNGQENQNFYIKHIKDGYFAIEAAHSGKVLDVKGGHGKPGDPVCQFPFHGGDNQLWKIEITDTGKFTFISKLNNLVLDVEGGKTEDRTPLIVWEKNKGLNQQFILKNIEW